MLAEINTIEITDEEITLEGTDMESFLMTDNLFEDKEEKKLFFVFKRDSEPQMKYLYTVAKNNKEVKKHNDRAFGKMLNRLAGQILNLPESFLRD